MRDEAIEPAPNGCIPQRTFLLEGFDIEIQPGITETDMTAGVKQKYNKLISEGLTIQSRWGKPDDVGKAVLALVSGYFPYSSGQIFMVDGGLTIPRL